MNPRALTLRVALVALVPLPLLPPLQQPTQAEPAPAFSQPQPQSAAVPPAPAPSSAGEPDRAPQGTPDQTADDQPAEAPAEAPATAAPIGALDARRHDALEFSAGTFTPAGYGPDRGNGWCTALTFCSEDPLFGSLFSLSYIRRLWNHNQHNLDLDVTGYGARQSVDGPTETFGMVSLVPTYRLRLPRPLSFLTAGIGVGVNVSIGDMPSEDPHVPVNSQLNLELALTPLKDSSFEVTFALEHRCTLFGLLNTVDGSLSGSQWYTIGVRKWF
jgi:hypothetical protein